MTSQEEYELENTISFPKCHRCMRILRQDPLRGSFLIYLKNNGIEIGGEMCSNCFHKVVQVLCKEK